MKLKTLAFVIMLFSSCAIKSDLANAQAEQTKETKEVENLGSIQIIAKGETFWNITNPQDFGTYSIERTSNVKDADENFLRPFNKVSVSKIHLKSKPTVGDKITVIPLEIDLPPFELAVTKTEKTVGKSCDRKNKSVFWNTEVESITKKVFFEVKPLEDRGDEYPFDLFIIYPSNPKAMSLKKSDLKKSTIPYGVSINTIVAAIDTDNDKNPDYLKTEYCCRNKSESYNYKNECSYCKNNYQKKNDEWKTIHISKPCK